MLKIIKKTFELCWGAKTMTTKEISTTEILFIRACKSNDSINNINRVYRKFYYADYPKTVIPYDHLARIMTSIVQKCDTTLTISRLILEMNPSDGWKVGVTSDPATYNYWEHVTKVMVSIIRLLPVACIPNYPIPCRMRREFKGEQV